MIARADDLRIDVDRSVEGGGTLIDCGVQARGGLEAGRLLSEVCLAGLGHVTLQRGRLTGTDVVVATDHPVAACMGSQYAGWQIAPENADGFFAMGSGPMRAAAAKEPLIDQLGCRETIDSAVRSSRETPAAERSAISDAAVVGVLETSRTPPREVFQWIAEQCGVRADHLVLLAARTASFAGNIQVVARSIETALHKIHELGFDLKQVKSGFGAAPLPPVAQNDLQGIGWTNDAVLYGAEVTLWVDADDEDIRRVGPKIPSRASDDYGAPFAEIYDRYGGDFYKIDPHLFSPAVVQIRNLRTASSHRFGEVDELLLTKSFRL